MVKELFSTSAFRDICLSEGIAVFDYCLTPRRVNIGVEHVPHPPTPPQKKNGGVEHEVDGGLSTLRLKVIWSGIDYLIGSS